MSSEIYSANGPSGNNASLEGITVGGSKPLHRFIKGQPKIIGIIVLVLGVSFFMMSITFNQGIAFQHKSTAVIPGFLQGTLYILCGILYILTEHDPTKKRVTASLALSIVTILGAFLTITVILIHVGSGYSYRYYDYLDENMTDTEEPLWASDYEVIIFFLLFIVTFFGGLVCQNIDHKSKASFSF
ncbi:hypothetical protein PAMA_020538 [Pampus argenteus]